MQQLNSLAGGIDWFGPGSRIIITTRYENVLDDHASNNGVEVEKFCITEGSRSTVKEENVVGLVKDFKIVINQLKGKDSLGNVVSIVGMGGLGKTTLARKIYNSDEVNKLFPCRAWATVSKDYREKEVFKSLLNCLEPAMSKSKHEDSSREEDMKQKVRKYLKGKKYLVVLDDVWDSRAWATLKDCFPENKNGGMILITTRNDQVAYFSRSKEPHHKLSYMDDKESWELFRNEVFGGEECPTDLKPIGKSIAKSCKGLPLAIKTTAGIVTKRERSEDAWKQIMNLLPYWCVAEDKEGSEGMMKILKFSYDDLPKNIKPCFLYLGVFPEDDKIRVRDLIELWIAEGFIEPRMQTGRSSKGTPPEPEDIGEQYLKELVDRNLVQVASRSSDGKGVKTCQVHDLIRQLCISESEKPDNNAPRLSFPSSNVGSYVCLASRKRSCTCSLFFYGYKEGWTNHIPKDSQVNVLYFTQWKSTSQGDYHYLKRLKALRYLRLHYFDLDKSLVELSSAETLYILRDLPLEVLQIGEFKQLKHLHQESCLTLSVDEEGVNDKMQSVQTLCYVYPNSQLWFLLDNDYFPNLRKLGLSLNREQSPAELSLRSLRRLSNLRKLKLKYVCFDAFPLSDTIAFPSNLTKITLSSFWSFESKHMNTLGRIRSLQYLKLRSGKCSETLNCGSAGSFPRLQVFIMISVSVTYLTSEEGAMPRLRYAVFRKCPKLKEVTTQMRSLGSNLEYVKFDEKDHADGDAFL